MVLQVQHKVLTLYLDLLHQQAAEGVAVVLIVNLLAVQAVPEVVVHQPEVPALELPDRDTLEVLVSQETPVVLAVVLGLLPLRPLRNKEPLVVLVFNQALTEPPLIALAAEALKGILALKWVVLAAEVMVFLEQILVGLERPILAVAGGALGQMVEAAALVLSSSVT
jgi:hypothetical protein